jgi:hypothetical protein
MRIGKSIVLTLLVLSGIRLPAQEKELLFVQIRNAAGQTRGGESVRAEPYAPGKRERPDVCLPPEEPAGRDRDGEVVRCFAIYAWQTSPEAPIHVRALLFFPLDPKAASPPTAWRSKELASYTVKKGQTLRMDEMKSLGLEPFSLAVEQVKSSKPRP